MIKIFAVILTLLAFTNLSFAQENPASWQFYKSASGDFSAEFPTLSRSSEIIDPNTKKLLGNLYKTYFNKSFYFIVACQTTDCPQFDVIKKLKFRARNSASSRLSEKTLDDSTVESSFTDSEGFFQKIRQIKTEKTYYILHTVSELEDNPDADRFLNSFQLKVSSDNAPLTFDQEKFDSWLVNDTLDVDLPTNNPKDTSNPLSNPAPSSSKKEAPMVQVSILTKPLASYTDAARAYEISGQVQLRVTFLSSKTVSTISPLKKLPFGLTEQAIAAAKEISFNPALRDSKPFTVSKSVLYTFTVYK